MYEKCKHVSGLWWADKAKEETKGRIREARKEGIGTNDSNDKNEGKPTDKSVDWLQKPAISSPSSDAKVASPPSSAVIATADTVSLSLSPHRSTLPFQAYIISSAISTSTAGCLTNILDVIKTRYQTAHQLQCSPHNASPSAPRLNSTVNITSFSPFRLFLYMYRHEGGAKVFVRGMGMRIMWMVPAAAISMTTYEILKERGEGKEIRKI